MLRYSFNSPIREALSASDRVAIHSLLVGWLAAQSQRRFLSLVNVIKGPWKSQVITAK
jgi:hypothetical protein